MAGAFGRSRSNDIVPNGPIFSIPDVTLPGTITFANFGSVGSFQPSILNAICTGTFSIGSAALPTAGVAHAANAEIYLPVNGQVSIFIQGSGTFSSTLYTTRSSEA